MSDANGTPIIAPEVTPSIVGDVSAAAAVEDASEMTQEGRTATTLDAAMELRLGHAVRLSREEQRHTEAADILGELLQTACVGILFLCDKEL